MFSKSFPGTLKALQAVQENILQKGVRSSAFYYLFTETAKIMLLNLTDIVNSTNISVDIKIIKY